ncbi:MAG: YihA family ribosome biogenesis GTP-binding protein [Deltaproteobacteria bacterium]|nr:MAG: YihA family ribosome biogenesis GTP-binding protein [Deltaproteobacteria bacterium]
MSIGRINPSRAEFLLSSPKWRDVPDFGKPLLVVGGRSNVGKSSFINMILRRKGLARTSSTPGRTQLLNFFDVDGAIVLVDVPGYGFAKAPKGVVKSWTENLTGFIENSRHIACVVQLLDIRRDPTGEDKDFASLVESAGKRLLPVITKADKVARGHRLKRASEIAKALGVKGPIVVTSSKEGLGRDEVWDRLYSLLETFEEEAES